MEKAERKLMEIPEELYPLFAPLPVPFAAHLMMKMQNGDDTFRTSTWNVFFEDFQLTRDSVFPYMNPFVRLYLKGGKKGPRSYSTAWFLQVLAAHAPKKRKVAASTITYWMRTGTLRSKAHGIPDEDSAMAFLIARILDKKSIRGFIPSTMEKNEPDWWCWMKTTPTSTPTPCPIPLPSNLPLGAFLWTPHSGASFDENWLLIGKKGGAVRFAGTDRSRVDGTPLWNIAEEDLLAWYPPLAPLLAGIPKENRIEETEKQNMKHTLATFALQQLATVYLR